MAQHLPVARPRSESKRETGRATASEIFHKAKVRQVSEICLWTSEKTILESLRGLPVA